MTVSAGVGGGTLGGVVVGSAAGGGSVTSLPATLPFTGASHLMLIIAVAFILLVAGVLMTGLARRLPDHTAPTST